MRVRFREYKTVDWQGTPVSEVSWRGESRLGCGAVCPSAVIGFYLFGLELNDVVKSNIVLVISLLFQTIKFHQIRKYSILC